MARIEVEGKSYKVTESLGYMHGAGIAKFVRTPDGEKVAVKRGGRWVWWTVQERLPLSSYEVGPGRMVYRNDSNRTFDTEDEDKEYDAHSATR